MAQSTQQTTEQLARTVDNLPGPALPRKEVPSSTPPCCSTAHRITLHLELTHSGRSSARFGGRISVSASLFPPACSPLAGDRSAGCRRQQQGGGSLGRTAPHPGYQPFPGLPCGCPCHGREAAPVPVAVAGWAGGLPPAFICMCVVGRGEALHLIILRIFLCCGCCYCGDWTLPASCLWGGGYIKVGVPQSLPSFLADGRDAKAAHTCLPCSPAWHGTATVLPHMKGVMLHPH